MEKLISDAKKLLEQHPDCEVWAEYTVKNGEKKYGKYEVALPGMEEPKLLQSEQFELIFLRDLVSHYEEKQIEYSFRISSGTPR